MEGLDKLEKLILILKNLPKEVLKSADTAMVNNSKELLDYNRDQLKQTGTDSQGKSLRYKHPRKGKVTGVYTQAYNRFKGKQGGNISFVDINLSGEFLNNLRLDHTKIGLFRIYSETSGFDLETELKWNYGNDIFGLWDTNLQKFCDINLKPEIEFELETLITRI